MKKRFARMADKAAQGEINFIQENYAGGSTSEAHLCNNEIRKATRAKHDFNAIVDQLALEFDAALDHEDCANGH